MRRLTTSVIIGLVIGFFSVVTILQFYSYELISLDFASVVVENKTGQTIKNIEIKHSGGVLEGHELVDDGEIRFIFRNGVSENTLTVNATLNNDSIVTMGGVYFEYGYRGIVTVSKSGIKVEDNW